MAAKCTGAAYCNGPRTKPLLIAVVYAPAARRHLMLPCSLMTVSAGSVVSTYLAPVANDYLVNNVVLQCMDI